MGTLATKKLEEHPASMRKAVLKSMPAATAFAEPGAIATGCHQILFVRIIVGRLWHPLPTGRGSAKAAHHLAVREPFCVGS
jgi:hypothetical protein